MKPRFRVRSGTLALLSVFLAVAPSRAAEDGGTQSLFATGAGTRALAMGGAYVAIGDDASAMLWNPATLGLVDRARVEAVHTSGYELGLTSAYAALAWPDWRWGTAGLALRYFGAGGIERRDDRNVLLDDNLSDSEVETSLGYGRSFGPAWRLGASLKFRRHSLAGLGANAFGADVGAIVEPAAAFGWKHPWASGLSCALSFRNAVEPSLRLDREGVPDPRVVVAGFAYRGSGLKPWAAEVDVETVRGGITRARLGSEVRLLPNLALRMGLTRAGLHAGAGVGWRSASVDYALESTGLTALHRVGITYGFGASTDEARLAARTAEDAALEKRIAQAFRQRQDEQVTELLARAEASRAGHDYDDALEALTLVTTLEPGHARATAMTATCYTEKALVSERAGEFSSAVMFYERALAVAPGDSAALAGRDRSRAASDRRAQRSLAVRQRFAQGIEALASGNLVRARDEFAAVVRAEPSDAEAVTMLGRTRRTIAERAAQLVGQAQRTMKLGLVAEAGALLDQARELDREAPGLREADAALAHARELESAAVRTAMDPSRPREGARVAPTARSAPATLSDREIDALYRQGLQALEAKRGDDALRYFELVWSARHGYREVDRYLKREYIARGMEAFAAGQMQAAIDLWGRALQVDPRDERARGYLERAQKQVIRSREILGATP